MGRGRGPTCLFTTGGGGGLEKYEAVERRRVALAGRVVDDLATLVDRSEVLAKLARAAQESGRSGRRAGVGEGGLGSVGGAALQFVFRGSVIRGLWWGGPSGQSAAVGVLSFFKVPGEGGSPSGRFAEAVLLALPLLLRCPARRSGSNVSRCAFASRERQRSSCRDRSSPVPAGKEQYLQPKHSSSLSMSWKAMVGVAIGWAWTEAPARALKVRV